jgi:uncharacterized protein YndB with AHSA1/START domain
VSQESKENEIHITRFYDAPVNLVWEAWTDPAQVAQWWGPRGFTITTHSKDLRVGGHWAYTMHGPDGTNYENKTLYFEVIENERLVYDHGGNDERPPLFRVTVKFSQETGRTRMDMTMTVASKEAAEQTRQMIKGASGESTWDRLAEYLEKNIAGTEAFVINRSFAAPVEVVFDAFTDPVQIAQWLSPKGTDMAFFEADIRTGGKTWYRMGNESFTMYGRASYLKVERPREVVYTQQFCDKDGNISRHPLAPTWPETMLTRITFTALGAASTLVTVHWQVTGAVTAQEMATFIEGRRSMTQGWTGSLDKLEQHLISLSRNAA